MLILTGCTTQSTPVESREPVATLLAPAASACVTQIGGRQASELGRLNADDFGVVNWNVQKGGDPRWADDLAEMYTASDLLILQEASPKFEAWQTLAPGHFHAFAAGYRGNGQPTGVLTVSAVEPVAECDLVSHEPWLGTRKATLVTEYGLSGTDETLLVVNIHGVNFSIGVRELERQLREAEAIIATHAGPVLFSGDFNTWRGRRAALLDDVVSSIGLEPLEYDDDYRKRFLGWPLDHIYVRGLETVAATTRNLDSSDHNPMLVRFRFARGGLQ